MKFSYEDKQIMVNYHYVEDPRPDFQGIHPCAVKEFERQIAFLSANYSFATVPEVERAAARGSDEKLCAITFDDGLQDQYEYALPILKKYGARATFFIITSTLLGKIPTAHKIHVLLSRVEPDELIDVFNDFIRAAYPDSANLLLIPKDRKLTERRIYDDMFTANIKEALTVSPQDIQSAFLRHTFVVFALDEASLCLELFMDENTLRKLRYDGFSIGNHTHSHASFEHESREFLYRDLTISQGMLTRILEKIPTVVAYPYGRPNKNVSEMLVDAGFTHGVTVEQRRLEKSDHPLFLPRYNTNDIKLFLDNLTV